MQVSNSVTDGLSTGSRTIADLLPLAAERYGDKAAARFKRDGKWQELSYKGLNAAVEEVSLGLIKLGIEHGDKVCILSNTRVEWTIVDFGITCTGATVVPIYPTNSPEECEWVAANSEAKIIVCENAEQIAKITAVRERLPQLQKLIVIDPGGDTADAISLDDVRSSGRDGDRELLKQRIANVSADDNYTFIYTSGTTGPPKGCISTHGNYRSVVSMAQSIGLIDSQDTVYLFLPLAHGFALLLQLASLDSGLTIAYFGGDTRKIVEEVAEIKPTLLPSVPRIFEKIYTAATCKADEAGGIKKKIFWWAIGVGKEVEALRQQGKQPSGLLKLKHNFADKQVFSKVRHLLGGNVKKAITGAAPIAPDILEFFYACGTPVLEAYGMTETSTASSACSPTAYKIGTVGRPLPGVEVKIAEDGEILLRGANIFHGYYKNPEATAETIVDGWLHTGDLGAVDSEGYLSITGRKKDIIITAGGKNLTPANLENDLKQSRWISQAVMHGDRRPYPVALVTLDEEEILPFAKERGLPVTLPELAENSEIREMIQKEFDRVNACYAQVEQIKKFKILPHDLTQETGELTPTLKVKRNVVNEKYADLFEALYN